MEKNFLYTSMDIIENERQFRSHLFSMFEKILIVEYLQELTPLRT